MYKLIIYAYVEILMINLSWWTVSMIQHKENPNSRIIGPIVPTNFELMWIKQGKTNLREMLA